MTIRRKVTVFTMNTLLSTTNERLRKAVAAGGTSNASALASWATDYDQLPSLLNPGPKVTIAQRLLCALGDSTDGSESKPASIRGWMMHGYGYKAFVKAFTKNEYACVQLRASTNRAAELTSLIAYPDSHGHGSVMMTQVCKLAD